MADDGAPPPPGAYAAPPPAGYGPGAPGAGAGAYMPAPPAAAPFNPYAGGFVAANPAAWAMFTAVDANRSGSVDAKELHAALSHGGWTKFSPKTTRLLMKMFDADRTGARPSSRFPSVVCAVFQSRMRGG